MLKRKDKGLAVPVVVTILMLVAVAVGVLTYNVAFDVSDTTMGGVDQAYETLTKDNLEYPKPGDIPGAYPGGNLGGNTGTGGGGGESEGTTPEETFVISFNANGHTFDDGTYINQVTYVIEDEQVKIQLGILKLPVSDTHEFTGWYLDAICSKPVTIPGEIREDTTVYAGMKAKPPVIYAVYSETDNSLRFYNRPKVPSKGEIYEGVVTSEVYTGFDDKNYTSTAGAPWYAQADKIKTIEFKDEVAFADGAYLFNGLSLVESVDLQGMNIDQARSTEGMFKNLGSAASSKVVIKNLGSLNTSKVTNMREMFSGVAYMADGVAIDLNGLETQNVTDMSSMFYLTGCYAEEVLLNNLNKMNVSKVQAMDHMFEFVGYSATETKLNLSTWQPDALVTANSMFANVGAYSDDVILIGPESWTMTNLQDATRMFRGLAYSDKEFALDLTNWKPMVLSSIEEMFDCMGYSSEKWAIGDISGWNTEAVTNANRAFAYAGAATSTGYKLNLINWNLAQANPVDIFKGTNYLKEITVGAQWVWSENGLLEKPSEACFANADGHWYDIDNKARFAPEELPDNVAATYHVAVPGYTVAFNANGGKFADGDINNVTYKIALVHAGEYKEPVRPGYAFAGWYLNAAGTGEQLVLGDFIAALSQDATVYAKWNALSDEILKGADFKTTIPAGTKHVKFVYEAAPDGIELTDVSVAKDGGVVAWTEGNVYKVSTQRQGVPVQSGARPTQMFSYNTEIETIDFEAFRTGKASDISGMFRECTALRTIEGLEYWDTSNVTTTSYLFRDCPSLEAIDGIGNWDTSKMTGFYAMFDGCSLVETLDVADWTIRNDVDVTLASIFANCKSLKTIDLSKWDFSGVTNMSYMFYQCESLEEIIGEENWDTSKSTRIDCIFAGAKALKSADVANWDTSNVTSFSAAFQSTQALKNIDLTLWNTSKATQMNGMFQSTKLESVGNINTKTVTNAKGDTYVSWDVSNVGNMTAIFGHNHGIKELDLSNWNVGKVRTFNYAFGDTWLETLGDISNWDLSSATNCSYMLGNSNFGNIDISKWNLSGLTTLESSSSMLYSLENMTELTIPASLKYFGDSFTNHSQSLKTITFLHAPEDEVYFFTAGWNDNGTPDYPNDDNNGPFFYKLYDGAKELKTTVITENELIKNYDWEADNRNVNKEYTISFDANGGTFSSSSINKVTYTKRFDVIVNIAGQEIEPTRIGYTFDGWYTTKDYTTEFNVDNVYSDATMYAKWSANTYTVKYDANGGLGTMNSVNHSYGTEKTLAPNSFTKPGYIFTGWNAKSDGSGTSYADSAKILNVTNENGAVITLYAQWAERSDIMASGSIFASKIPTNTTEVIFTYNSAPTGVETIDISAQEDAGVIGWMEGNKLYISTQRDGVKVKAGADLSNMFAEKRNIFNIDLTALDTSKTTNMSAMFKNTGRNVTTKFTINADLLDMSNVTKADYMFYSAGRSAAQDWSIGNLDGWDVSNVTNMEYMFYHAGNASKTWDIGTLENWNVSKVQKMGNMFYGAAYAASNVALDLTNWDTSSVKDFNNMFHDFGGNATNWSIGDISYWDTSKVTNMGAMFQMAGNQAKNFVPGDLGTKVVTRTDGSKYVAWNMENVTTIANMFYGAGSSATFWSIGDISNWNTSKITNFQRLFNTAHSALNDFSFDLSTKDVTLENGMKYKAWDVSSAKDMLQMFYCFRQKYPGVIDIGDLSTWNTSNVTNTSKMFLQVASAATSFEYGGLSGWDVSKVTNISYMFQGRVVTDISNWDMSSVTNAQGMFSQNPNLKTLTIPASLSVIDVSFASGCGNLQMVTFLHSATDAIEFPEPGFISNGEADNVNYDDITGAFYVPSNKPLTVITENQTVKDYAWETDNRKVSIDFTVTYDADGGEVGGNAVNVVEYNDRFGVRIITSGEEYTPTRPGYVFSGWNTKADGSGTTYKDHTLALNLINNDGATLTLYAMWTPRSEILVAGPTFANNIPTNATEVLFTYDIAPAGATLYDLSEAKDSGVVGWMSGTKFYVSTQRPGVKVKTGTNASNMFYNKSNIINIDLTALDSSAATTMSRMFYYAGGNSTTSFTVNANLLNTSNVTNMEGMFYRCGYQAKDWSIGNLDGFDTSKVTNMANIFYCAGVNATNWDIGTLSTWKTGKVTTFYRAFHSAAQHTPNAIAIDLSNWDTSNVTTMQQMFMYFGYKTPYMEIGDIGNWNTSKVTNFADFMRYATATSSVADFGNLGTKIVTRADGSTYVAWDVANATTMENMFYYVGLNAERFDIGNIGNWNVSKVTNMKGMFEQAGAAATYWYIGDLSTKTITYIHDAPYTAWDVKNVTDMSRMFMSCAHSMPIVSIGNIGAWDVSKVTTFNNFMRSFGYLSESCYIGDLSNWNVSGANDMESMFHSCATFATDIDIGDILKTWDISNVTNTKLMFKGSMTQSPFFNDADFSQWDFSNVTDNSKMFYMNTGIHNLTLPASLRKIDEGFIAEDHELQSITFLHDEDDTVAFAQPGAIYGEKDGAYDDDTFGPFYHPSDGALIKLTVNTVNPHIQNYDWETDHRDVSQRFYITYHGNGGTFNGATKNEVRYSNRFDVITLFSGTEMTPTKPGYAFAGWYTDANCATEFDISGRVLSASAYAKWEPLSLKLVSGADFNAAIPGAATSVVFTTEEAPINAELNDLSANKDAGVVGWLAGNTYYVSTQRSGANPQAPANASTMFKNKTSLTTIDVRALETEQTTNMEEMFRGCTSLTTIAGLAEFDTSKVITMKNMFRGNTNLLNGSLAGISGWDMSKVTSIYSMFRECTQLTMLNTGNWKTDSLTNSEYVFYDCTNLEAVDVSKWNMSKVTTAKYMFYGTTNLTNLGTNNVRNWDVRNLKDASWMFGVSGLNELDVSLWNTQSLVDASAIFNTLNNLTELDVSNWNTSNVTTFHGMFANSDNLETLGTDGVKNWNTEKVTNTYAMFNACSSLTEIDVSNWDTSSLETAYKMFWHCISLQSVDISNWDMSKVTNTTKMFSNCKSLKELVIPASLKVIGMGFGNELYDIKIVFKHAPTDEVTFVSEPGLHSTATDSYNIDCGAFYSLAKQEITLDAVHPAVLNYDWETDNKVVKFDSDEIITFAIMENGVANEYVAYAGSNFGEWLDGSLDSNDYYADSSNGVIADGFTLYSFEDYFLTPIETSTEIVEGRIYHRGRNAAGRLTIYDPSGVKHGTWQFEPGMTFREMADSEYNIGGMIYIHPDNASDSVYTEWSRTQPISVEGFARPSDVIPDNAVAQISPEHGGGTND